MSIITIERKVLEKNDQIAAQNREKFIQSRIFTINMVSSPGAGKTSILEKTLSQLKDKINIAIVVGDVQTDLDAQRIEKFGIPVVQIVTHGSCHLDAKLVQDAINNMNLDGIQLLIIENVGNLVCPANYDLGEHMKVVIASIAEGEDKPLKYPAMFRNASVLIINKIDLLAYTNCNLDLLKNNALRINPNLKVFQTSCTTNEGINEWCNWLEQKVNETWRKQ